MSKSGCQVKTRTLCISQCAKDFLEIHTVTNIDDVWEIDLADLGSLTKYNDKYKYLLNIIDIFSRYAWSVPLKDKTGKSIVAALTLYQIESPLAYNQIKVQSLLMQLSNIT